jgi:uncharacterized protein YecE (DUF72 family)
MSIHIGTSGWHYEHWVGAFYPEGTKPEAMLEYYAGVFRSVELNSTFYRLPEPITLAHWRDSTPAGFVLAFKAGRYVTHVKKLRDPDRSLGKTVAAARVLGEKLGPILFQLPPHWGVNPDRLQEFLLHVPEDVRAAFEFRDPSWFTDEVYELLRRHRAALCIYDLDGRQAPSEVTSDLVYVRLHGPGGPYQGLYDQVALSAWKDAIAGWDRSGKDVFCFFDNDERGFAAENARELQAMLGSAEPIGR